MTRDELVERSIRLLHEHDSEIDHRSAFNSLWKFHGSRLARLRVMPVLLERRATYRFDKDVHPAIETLDDTVDPDLGYVDDAFVYCDAGSTLWRQLREELSDGDLVAPVEISLSTLIEHIERAAKKVGDVEVIARWHQLVT